MLEELHPVPGKDTPNRRTWDIECIANPVWTPLVSEVEREDLLFRYRWCSHWARVGAGTVFLHGLTSPIPTRPFLRRCRGDLDSFSSTTIGPPVINNEFGELQSSLWRE